jgi:uncharacterized protein
MIIYSEIGKMDITKLLFLSALLLVKTAYAQTSPSFDCTKVGAGSIEAMVCKDSGLIVLDNKMAQVYAEATKKAVNEHPPILKAEQRGWVKGRNDCWKSSDKRACVEAVYRDRIVELQARYRLVKITGTATYRCPNNAEVIATYFETDPKTAIAEYGDATSMMYVQPSASGTKYQGPNETLWESKGEAKITWGYGSPEMNCVLEPKTTKTP